jgi:PAS domain S-box-containing protein
MNIHQNKDNPLDSESLAISRETVKMINPIQQRLVLRRNSQWLVAFAFVFLFVWWLPTPPALNGIAQYPAIHTAMETLAIVMTMLVFGITWNTYRQERIGNLIVFGCAMLAVGLIDFAHLLSFQGMPDFVSASGAEKAINFWLAARLLSALALLGLAALPRFRLVIQYSHYSFLGAALIITGLVYWLGLFHEQALPATFIEGQGLTQFKIAAEWLIVCVLSVPALLFFHQARRCVNHDAANLFAAVALSILSELCFMLYKDVADIFNLLGHLYKIGAYLFIYRAVFVETVHAPYQRLAETQGSLLREQEALRQKSEMLGFFYELPFIGMAITSPLTKRWLMVNDCLCEMLGYPRAELITKTWAELTHPDDLQADVSQFERLLAGEIDGYVINKRFYHKNGAVLLTTLTIRCVRNLDGSIQNVVATVQDITARHQLEETQRQNLQRFDTIANASPALFWTAGLDKGCDWFNQRWLNFTGRTMAQEQGNGWAEGVHPDDFDHCLAIYVNAFDTHQPFSMEYRLRRHDGEFRWLLDQGMPRYDADGLFIGYIGSCLDIADEKLTRAALDASEQRLRLALRAANQGIYDLNVQTGDAIVSPEYASMLGYDPDTFHETHAFWIERLHPDDLESVTQTYRRYIAGELAEYRVEFRQRTRSGQWKWILSLGSVVEWCKDGQPLRMLGTHTDIDTRKQAEARYRELFEANPHPMWVYDIETLAFLAVNDAAILHYGYSRQEFLSMTIVDIRPEEDIPRLLKSVAQVTEGISKVSEWRHKTRDGRLIDVEISSYFFSFDGRPAELVLAHDVTEQRRVTAEISQLNTELEQRVAERTTELLVLNQSLESFVYSVSHDLKTPLRGIEGYSKLLLEDYREKLDDEGLLFINNIRDGIKRMNELIDDLLAYSRMERRKLETVSLDLNRLLDNVLAERAEEFAIRNVQVDVNLPALSVEADADGLALVLRNLIGNALKFTSQTPAAHIEIRAHQDGDSITLWIKDNGIGFDMKYYERIFEIFQRLHRLEDYPGTGIGLALVKKAMQRMNGKVWAESTVGQGATFYLELKRSV